MYKKYILKISFVIFVSFLIFNLYSCKKNDVHNCDEIYTIQKYDEENHWDECSKCGIKEKIENHHYGEWKNIDAAPLEIYKDYAGSYGDCKNYSGEYRKCNDCPYTEFRDLVHQYSEEWIVDKEATCTEEGTKSRHCPQCDAKIDILPISREHDFSLKHDEGNHWDECSKCGIKEKIENHHYGEWKNIDAAPIEIYKDYAGSYGDCKNYSGEYRKCNDCPYTEFRDLVHQYSEEWTVDKEATCTEEGTKSRHCPQCDAKTDSISIPMLEHTFKLKFDEESHWDECSCSLKKNFGKHIIDGNSCIVCNFEKSYSDRGLVFELNEDGTEYFVVDITDEIDEVVSIPRIYNNLPVSGIKKNAFKNCNFIKELYIPISVVNIEEDAFIGCNNIEKVTLPSYALSRINIEKVKNVDIIGGGFIETDAFLNCASLTDLYISKSIKVIHNSAFNDCLNLKNIYYYSSIEGWCDILVEGPIFQETTSNHHFYYIENNMWKECCFLDIPKTISRVGDYQFYGFDSILSVHLPKGLISIGNKSFYNCKQLREVYNQSPLLLSIGNVDNGYVSYYAHNIRLSLADESIYIRQNDFLFYKDIESKIHLAKYYGDSKQLILPNEIEGEQYCIDFGAFQGLSDITTITLPFVGASINGTENTHFGYIFGASSYSDNSKFVPINLKEVIITGGKNIGERAFYNCINLTNITLPNSVMEIGESAFEGCNTLDNVYYEGKVEEWNEIIFSNVYADPMHYAKHFYIRNDNNIWKEVTCLLGKIEHSFGQWITVIEPNHYEEGKKERECSVCHYKEEVIIEKIPHSYTYKFNATSHWLECSCGEKIEQEIHSFSQWVTIIEPNHYEEGKKERECSVCYYKEEVVIEKIPHSYTYKFNTTSHWLECSCGEKSEKESHSFCNWVITVEPTNNKEGLKERKCSICQYKEEKKLPVEIGTIGLNYTLSNDKKSYSVSGLGKATDLDIIIPSVHYELPVTSIADYAFSTCSSITSIVIPNSVTSIGWAAFENCSNLTSITIPFVGASLNGTENTHFGYIFGAITAEENVSLVPVSLKEVIITGGTKIGANAFGGCMNIVNISLPNSIRIIGMYSFVMCSSLESIVIPNMVRTIEIGCFAFCSGLKNVKLGDGLECIKEGSFYNCNELSKIVISNNIVSIEDSAFQNCNHLESVTIGRSVESIVAEAFVGCYRLVEVYNLSNLNITVGSSSNGYIGYYAKVIHTSLSKESRLIEKDNYVFIKDNNNKYYLVSYKGTNTELVLPNDIEGNNYTINQYAFRDCISLISITIPDSVTSVGYQAFFNCDRLVEVYNLSKLNITVGSSDNGYIGYYAKVIHTSLSEESRLIEKDNYVFIKDNNNQYYLVSYKGTNTELVLPSDIEQHNYEINDNAFSGYISLTSVVIPNSVTKIGVAVFYNCINLRKVELENNITVISDFAFSNCLSLTSITIPNSVTSIGLATFSECSNLTSVVIGNGVTSIGISAFYGCSGLKEVYYKGTSNDWSRIYIKSDNSNLNSETIYYYSETKPTEEGNYWHYVNNEIVIWN